MPYNAYGMPTPVSEYNEKTIQKSPKTQNYSTQSMDNLPVIIAEVSVAHSIIIIIIIIMAEMAVV